MIIFIMENHICNFLNMVIHCFSSIFSTCIQHFLPARHMVSVETTNIPKASISLIRNEQSNMSMAFRMYLRVICLCDKYLANPKIQC